MTSVNHSETALPPIKCPNCNQKLSHELELKAYQNKPVVCEYCGNLIDELPPIYEKYRKLVQKDYEFSDFKKERCESGGKNNNIQEKLSKYWDSILQRIKSGWIKFVNWWNHFWKKLKGTIKPILENSPNKTRFSNLNEPNNKMQGQNFKETSEIMNPKYELQAVPILRTQNSRFHEDKAKFDPETGQPLNDKNLKQKTMSESLSDWQNRSEVYTVLESDIRSRLLHLPITHHEQDIIAKSFIYMTVSQQAKYLTEIERVNQPPSANINKLLQVINDLPIPKHQKKVLLDQLNYIPDQDHHEFMKALENSQKETSLNNNSNEDPESPSKPSPSSKHKHGALSS